MDAIYSLLSGMKGQQMEMEAVSNNLANVNTPGYKEDTAIFREYYDEVMGQDLESEEEKFVHKDFISPANRRSASFVKPDMIAPTMKRGKLSATGNVFDLAMQTDGFFVVQTPMGERYTRNGQFMKDADNFLITPTGDRVLGKKGPIKISGNDFFVGRDGSVVIDRQPVDNLKIVDFPDKHLLTKLGNSYWAPSHEDQVAFEQKNVVIHQSVLEGSNVDPVEEMTKMITVNRSYEASQRALRSIDALDEKSISISRVV